jgi:hypothetical protein
MTAAAIKDDDPKMILQNWTADRLTVSGILGKGGRGVEVPNVHACTRPILIESSYETIEFI